MSNDHKNDEKIVPATKLPEIESAQEVPESDLDEVAGGCFITCLADSCNGTSVTGTKVKAQ